MLVNVGFRSLWPVIVFVPWFFLGLAVLLRHARKAPISAAPSRASAGALSAAAPEAPVSSAPPPPEAVSASWWVRALARIPLAALYGVAYLVAWMAYRVVPYRKQLVQASLATAFPELSEGQLRAVRRRYYLRFAQMAVELIKASAFAPAEIRRRVRIVNLEEPQALLAQGQSVLLIAAHQSNWEWMLLALALELGYPLDAAYKPLANDWAEREMKKLRTRFGSRLVPAKELLLDSYGRRPGADHQRAQVLDAFPQPRHRLLHGSGGDCACHALPGVLHRHASPGARLLRDGVPAARRRRRCHAARRAHRPLRAPGRGADPRRAPRLAVVAQALEAEEVPVPEPLK